MGLFDKFKKKSELLIEKSEDIQALGWNAIN